MSMLNAYVYIYSMRAVPLKAQYPPASSSVKVHDGM